MRSRNDKAVWTIRSPHFATWVAKWTGSQWAFIVAALLVLVGLLTTDMQTTNLAISVVTLLMVLVLQNTQNRHSAALHLKLDEVVRAEPEARDEIRGVESRPEREIRELTREETETHSVRVAEDASRAGRRRRTRDYAQRIASSRDRPADETAPSAEGVRTMTVRG